MWGVGQSTSKAEAQAAANSGIATADLPVSYTLPPELLTAWQTSNRPGLSLVGADLRPETMINNVRASVFPHLQQQVQSSIALSMSRQAWGDVEVLEQTHEWKCGDTKPTLRMVQPVVEEGQEARRIVGAVQPASSSDENAAAKLGLPPVTPTEKFLGKWWSGQLWKRTPKGNPFASGSATESAAAASAAAAAAATAAAASPSTEFVAPSGIAPVRFLSSERWLIQRCDGHQVYRVQYFGNGDSFYAQVVPTNLSGLATTAWVAIKQALAP